MTTEPAAVSKPYPQPTEFTQFYWDAARERRLEIQHCDDCQKFHHWPMPRCPHCGSQNLTPKAVSGRGTVYTFTVIHHLFHPAFKDDLPYVTALIELEEQDNLRVFTNIVETPIEDVRVGMPVEVLFENRGEWVYPQFRAARSS